jgi:hypothetical protein
MAEELVHGLEPAIHVWFKSNAERNFEARVIYERKRAISPIGVLGRLVNVANGSD